jgi:hypothetical protein
MIVKWIRSFALFSIAAWSAMPLIVTAGKGRTGHSWLLLVYQVPGKPSRLRSTVWREIKRLGAVYLRNSVAVLPASRSAEHALDKLSNTILGLSGRAVLLSCEVLAGESDIKAAFESARTDEYEEVTDKCAGFMTNLDKKCEEEQFSYAELDKRTTELIKLRKLLRRVRDRDVFGTEALQAALGALVECQKKLDTYAIGLHAQKSARRQ